MPRKTLSHDDIRALHDEIVARLDLASEFAKLGIRLASSKPTSSGWLACHAIDRDDRNPSAAVNVSGGPGVRGRYKDLGGSGLSLPFFKVAAQLQHGNASNWRESRKHYAEQVGIADELPRRDRDADRDADAVPDDKLKFRNKWQPRAITGLLHHKPGLTAEGCRLTGARIASWINRYQRADETDVIAWPAFGPELLDGDPSGYAVMYVDGVKQFRTRAGWTPKRNVGPSGLVGLQGVRLLAAAKTGEVDKRPELVVKVEGITDLVALQAVIPDELLDRIAVVTTLAGAREKQVPFEVRECFRDLDVVVIHDADEPGQSGAETWCEVLGPVAKTIRNLELPYPVERKHGKDLRDWLNTDGNEWAALRTMIDSVDPESGLHDDSATPHDQKYKRDVIYRGIFRRLGMVVLGTIEGTDSIACFSKVTGSTFKLDKVDKVQLANLVHHLGSDILDEINQGKESDPQLIELEEIRLAIASEASKHVLSWDDRVGAGVWEIGGRTILVGPGRVATVNGKVEESRVPRCDDKLLDLDFPHEWYDTERLQSDLKLAGNTEWRRQTFRRLVETFGFWNNWKLSDCPLLMAGLATSAWVQSVWAWRPTVVITGERNTGKSVMIGDDSAFLPTFFGELAYNVARPSAASVRIGVGSKSVVLLIDEFEPDRRHRDEILELIRTSSRGSTVTRATASQRVVNYGLRHIPFLAAKLTGMDDAADRSRVLEMELEIIPPDQPRTLGSNLPSPAETRRLGEHCLAIAIHCYRSARKIATDLTARHFPGGDSRMVESLSVPLGMAAVAMGESVEWAADRVRESVELRSADDESSDRLDVLDAILTAKIRRGAFEFTVAQLLSGWPKDSNEAPSDLLATHGIVPGDGEAWFNANVVTQHLLRDTPFRGRPQDVGQALRRLDGASAGAQRRLHGRKLRGVSVPLDGVIEQAKGVVEETGVEELDFGEVFGE